jgi:hypothetical protein
MNPTKAIVVLAVPFAIVCLVFLAGMCATPYWDCSALSLPSNIVTLWKPALFTLALFTAFAALVLWIDSLLIRRLVKTAVTYRTSVLVVFGAVVAVLPRIVAAAFGGQGFLALSPQLEYLPFAASGALFAVVLDRLIRRTTPHSQSQA